MNLLCERGTTQEYYDHETGQRFWSVSEIRMMAHDAYAGIPEQVLAAARHRGTLLHRRFWKMLAAREGLLPAQPPIPGLESYCEAMDEWADKNKVSPLLLESKSLNLKLGYAGTPDALVLYGPKRIVMLVDLKTGSPVPTEAIQLHLYKAMDGYERAKRLVDLHIKDNGTYEETDHTRDLLAWPLAMSALNLLKWRMSL